MGVQTFGQTDKSVDEIQSWAIGVDRAIAVFRRIGDWFAPHELVDGSPQPDFAVTLDAGAIWNGSSLTEVAAQTVTGFTVPSAGLTRHDRVVVDAVTGVATRVAGTPGTGSPTPQPPAIPTGKIPICIVTMTDANTAVRNADITDERSLISSLVAAGGYTVLESGSLPAAATEDVTDIPATYSMIIATLTGASSNTATRRPLIQVDTDNGASFDSTAGNYEGQQATGGVIADTAVASLAGDIVDGTAASTWDITTILFNYQGGGGRMLYLSVARYSVTGVTFITMGFYIGSASPINALRFLWNGSGSFDAGTYAVIGVK